MPRVSLSPLRVAQLAVVGCALLPLGFILVNLRSIFLMTHHLCEDSWRTRLAFGSPAIPGFVMMFWYPGMLRRRAARNVWTKEEIEAARRWLGQRWLFWALMGMMALTIGIEVWRYHLRGSGYFNLGAWLLLLPGWADRLRQSLPEPMAQTGLLLEESKPLRSEHWGQSSASV
jgi:hypothetical protein